MVKTNRNHTCFSHVMIAYILYYTTAMYEKMFSAKLIRICFDLSIWKKYQYICVYITDQLVDNASPDQYKLK